MSERETVVELPWAADSCPWVEKLRTVLPLTVAIRDGAVHIGDGWVAWGMGCVAGAGHLARVAVAAGRGEAAGVGDARAGGCVCVCVRASFGGRRA
jgi:hypothetical protein